MLNKLTFKDANLTVDWIGFKFQSLDNFAQTKLAEYLFNIRFNSYQESARIRKISQTSQRICFCEFQK